MLIVALLLAVEGCRAHPGQFAISLVEEYVHKRDVQERGEKLVGAVPEKADRMFGHRQDTLRAIDDGSDLLVYKTPKRSETETHYLVEVDPAGRIANLLAVKFNLEGLTDIHQSREIRGRVLGKPRAEAEPDGRLGEALRAVRSEENGHTICFYRPQGLIPKTYTEYCVLWYHRGTGVCFDDCMLGVIAGFTTDNLAMRDEGQ